MERRTFAQSILVLSAAALLAYQASISPVAAAAASGQPLMGGPLQMSLESRSAVAPSPDDRPAALSSCARTMLSAAGCPRLRPGPVKPTCSIRADAVQQV
jgi:hypothetical protein